MWVAEIPSTPGLRFQFDTRHLPSGAALGFRTDTNRRRHDLLKMADRAQVFGLLVRPPGIEFEKWQNNFEGRFLLLSQLHDFKAYQNQGS